jgi:hypothetical protein
MRKLYGKVEGARKTSSLIFAEAEVEREVRRGEGNKRAGERASERARNWL